MTYSAEYEREGAKTLRLVRWAIYLALAVAVLCLLLLVAAYFLSSTGKATLTIRSGSDVHAPIETGAVTQVTTESGATAGATIIEASLGSDPRIVVTSTGSISASAALDRWSLYLDDDSQVPLTGKPLGSGSYSLSVDAPIPDGRPIRFVHYDPDDSHGDIYFDVQ